MKKQIYIDDIQVIVDRLYGSADQPDDAAEQLMEYVGHEAKIGLCLSQRGGTFFIIEEGEDEEAAKEAVNEAIEKYYCEELCK